MTIGTQKLVAAAQDRGWKPADLAEAFGCSATHAWRLLNGVRRPGEDLMLQMKSDLGIEIAEWFEPAQSAA